MVQLEINLSGAMHAVLQMELITKNNYPPGLPQLHCGFKKWRSINLKTPFHHETTAPQIFAVYTFNKKRSEKYNDFGGIIMSSPLV